VVLTAALNKQADRDLFRELKTSRKNKEEEMNALAMPFP
jgi:hypothetical protein